MSKFRWHKKQTILAALCVVCLCVGGAAVARAVRQQDGFDPERYANEHLSGSTDVAYDKALFGGNRQQPGGLEVDHEQEEKTNLENGDADIRDEENSGTDAPYDLQVAGDGTGGSNTPNGPVLGGGAGGNAIQASGGTGSRGDGEGTGGAGGTGGSGAGGTGTVPGSGNGGTGGAGGDPDDSGKNDIPYGVDYTAPEIVQSQYPNAATDNINNVTANRLAVSGSLMQHFYPGECPRPSELKGYIGVSAVMSNGSGRDALQYCQNPARGGDYTIVWDTAAGDIGGADNCVGTQPGHYTATILYRGLTYPLPYDIVVWQVTLYDFEEPKAEGFAPLVQTAYPVNSPLVDLGDAQDAMYEAISERTRGDGHQHVNVVDPASVVNVCYSEYFGGWSEDKENGRAVGSRYKMKRPTAADIQNGVYNVDMYPVWAVTDMGEESDSPFYVLLTWNADANKWQTELVGFDNSKLPSPQSTVVVPDGVAVVDLENIARSWDSYGWCDYQGVEKLVLPASVSTFRSCGMERSCFSGLQDVTVAADNQSYLDIDGVVYNKTGKVLVLCPQAKTEIPRWSNRVETIGEYALMGTTMDTLTVPETVTAFGEGAFYNAAIGSMTLETTQPLTLGQQMFINDDWVPTDDPWIDGCRLTVGAIQINSTSPPILPTSGKGSCFVFSNMFESAGPWGSYDDTYGQLQIALPDSENDTLYLHWMALMQKYTDMATGADGTGLRVLSTPTIARGGDGKYFYAADGKNLLTGDGTTLALAATATAGDYRLPDEAQTVGAHAFLYCDEIASLTVPETVTTLEAGALEGATALKTILLGGGTAPTAEENLLGETQLDRLDVYLPDAQAYASVLAALKPNVAQLVVHEVGNPITINGNVYSETDGAYTLISWNKYDVYANVGTDVPVTAVADDAFRDCTALQGVSFPDSLQAMGSNLFANCPQLRLVAFNGEEPALAADTFAGVSAECFLPPDAAYDHLPENLSRMPTAASGYELRTESGCTALYGSGDLDKDGEPETALIRYLSSTDGTASLSGDTQSIAPGAFAGSDVQIVDTGAAWNLRYIGERAFADCQQLEEFSAFYETWVGAQAITVAADAFAGSGVIDEDTGRRMIASMIFSALPVCQENALRNANLLQVQLGQLQSMDTLDVSAFEAFHSAASLELRFQLEKLTGSFADWPNLVAFSNNYYEYDWSGVTFAYIGTLGENLFRGCGREALGAYHETFAFSFNDFPDWESGALGSLTDYDITLGFDALWYHDGVSEDFAANLDSSSFALFKNARSLTISGNIGNINANGESVPGTLTGSFADWPYLESLICEGTAAGLGDRLLADCTELQLVTMHDVNSIGEECFAGCTKLEMVMLNNTQSADGSIAIGAGAFSNCDPALVVYINYAPYLPTDSERERMPALMPAAETEHTEPDETGTQPSEAEPAETEPDGTQPSEAEPAETETTGTEPDETEPDEPETSKPEPAEPQPAETNPAQEQPAETQPAETEITAPAKASGESPAPPAGGTETPVLAEAPGEAPAA